MYKSIIFSLLIFSSPLLAGWKHTIKKYGTYLGCATVGCIATVLAIQHKKTRTFLKNLLFPNYVQAHKNLVDEVTTLNDHLHNANETINTTEQANNLLENSLMQSQTRYTSQSNELNALKEKVLSDTQVDESNTELVSAQIIAMTLEAKAQEQKLKNLLASLDTLELPEAPNNSNADQKNKDLLTLIDQLK